MKRQKNRNHVYFRVSDYSNDNEDSSTYPLQPTINTQTNFNILEAQIQEGDTLQAIALRFNCTVAELKRINKIEKEYEIHARKIIKIPVTPHSLLLENQPIVHRSGQSSPKHGQTNKENLSNERLLVAAASLSSEPSINEIILNTPIASNNYEDIPTTITDHSNAIEDPLLGDALNQYNGMVTRPHSISGQNMDLRDLSCSGSDCDISWIFLLICILVLCFAIPLIYVFYIAEQEEIHRHDHEVHNP